MKRSHTITLLIAGAALTACGESGTFQTGGEQRRAAYDSRQDCVREWGDTNCSYGSNGHGGFFYYGPFYGPSSRYWQGAPAGSRSVGSTSSAHYGGFGSTGHALSGGGA